jgi:hypothetical protein
MASWELSTDPKGGGARLSGGRGWAAWPGSLPILLELDKGVGKAAQVPRMAFFALRRRPCMSKSDKYQRFAEECLEIAQTAKDNQAKAVLLHMAQVWFRLAAEHAEHAKGG